MTEQNPLIYVTSMFTVRDMLQLEQTCKYMKHDDALWTFYYHEYKKKLDTYGQYHLDNLRSIFYGNKKRAIKAYRMREALYWLTFREQVEYLTCRRNILIYLIALWQRHGKEVIRDIVSGINSARTWKAADTIRWRVSCWTMLKGTSNTFFRRNYLPVY